MIAITTADYRPFTFQTEGKSPELVGFDVELARNIAKQLDMPLKFELTTWREVNRMIALGQYSLAVGGITITPEREKIGEFSKAYIRNKAVLVGAQKNLDGIQNKAFPKLADNLGVNRGGYLEEFARKLFTNAKVISLDRNEELLDGLLRHKYRFFLSDLLEIPVFEKEPRAKAENVTHINLPDEQLQAIFFSGNNRELIERFNRILVKLKEDGTMNKLAAKYQIPEEMLISFK